jgi:hypothetical protein
MMNSELKSLMFRPDCPANEVSENIVPNETVTSPTQPDVIFNKNNMQTVSHITIITILSITPIFFLLIIHFNLFTKAIK